MRRFCKRIRHQTRWQVYARVLPVVFLGVLLVGAFGWLVFTRYATDSLVEHDREEVAFLMDNLLQKTLVETLGLAARKADVVFEAAEEPGDADGPVADNWAADLLRDEYLAGAALVAPNMDPDVSLADFSMQSLSFVDSLAGPVNVTRLHAWFADNREYFRQGLDIDSRGGLHAVGAPVLADDNPWHPTVIFPPILIEEVQDGSQGSAGGDLLALLPVLVHEEEEGRELFHTVYFLSLNRMLTDLMGEEGLVTEIGTWWCVVNHQGRVIASADGSPTVGSLLENQHVTGTTGPLTTMSGADLVGSWRLGQPWQRSLFGSRLAPWVVTAGQSPEMPLGILVGHKALKLGQTNLGYISAVLGVALLALAIAIFGVTRVVGRVSDRVTVLAHNLEKVADGDYSRRIPAAGRDEVGRLIDYFNRMTASLDETQHELTEKTRHLEAALENRRLLDRAKDDFLVLISHEVRTPLTAIMGGVNILKSMVARVSGADRELLDKLNIVEVVSIIESSGNRLHGFMNDAIQMTSIQSSDKELELQPTPVGSLVELGLCGVREMAQMRNIEVVNGLEAVQDWQVLCDEKIMKLAFEKVLKNAVMHNYDEGRVVIREVESVPGEGRIAELPRAEDFRRLLSLPSFEKYSDLTITWRLIEIFNTGEAIPNERCDALFGKFELVGRIEHHQRGSGLSLPIAQSAIENHGGRICVHSTKLQGNSFYLLLPTVATADLANRAPAAESRLGTHMSGQEQRDRLGSRAGDKNVGQVADPARLKIEFQHQGAALPGDGDQAGRGIDGPGSANDQEEVTLAGRRR